jgi:hypothetical protein
MAYVSGYVSFFGSGFEEGCRREVEEKKYIDDRFKGK